MTEMAIATSTALPTQRRFTIGLSEILNFAYDAFCSNKLQFTLTSLAMAVGTALGYPGGDYRTDREAIYSAPASIHRHEHDLRRLPGRWERIDSTPDPMTAETSSCARASLQAS